MILLLCFLIGLFAGLRTFSAPVAVAWSAHLGWLSLDRPWSLIGSLPAIVLLTLAAVGELVFDKLPSVPDRTAPGGLIARLVTGAISGACIGAAHGQSALVGALLGSAGAVAGCFGGYQARTRLVKALATRDWHVALLEDVIAVLGSFMIAAR